MHAFLPGILTWLNLHLAPLQGGVSAFLHVTLVWIINAELIYDFYTGVNLHWAIFHICVACWFALKTDTNGLILVSPKH